jgi:hypothetical protein
VRAGSQAHLQQGYTTSYGSTYFLAFSGWDLVYLVSMGGAMADQEQKTSKILKV